jgi:hypothetical protein
LNHGDLVAHVDHLTPALWLALDFDLDPLSELSATGRTDE